MVGKKYFFLAFILSCFCGCANNTTKIVQAEFLGVTDSKPYADSLCLELSKEGHYNNPRDIELCFVIHNDTYEKIYLPIHTTFDSIAKSSINVFFMDRTDTIRTNYIVKKIPYDTNYICKGDSMIIRILITGLYKLTKDDINVNTCLDTLISKLRLEYNKSPKDIKDNLWIPDIEFGKTPQFYYEIPKDPSVLVSGKIHRDRVLVRTAQRGKQ